MRAGKESGRNGVDCRELFELFGDFELGDLEIDRVQISSRAYLEDSTQRMKKFKWPKNHNAGFACDGEILFDTNRPSE